MKNDVNKKDQLRVLMDRGVNLTLESQPGNGYTLARGDDEEALDRMEEA